MIHAVGMDFSTSGVDSWAILTNAQSFCLFTLTGIETASLVCMGVPGAGRPEEAYRLPI